MLANSHKHNKCRFCLLCRNTFDEVTRERMKSIKMIHMKNTDYLQSESGDCII